MQVQNTIFHVSTYVYSLLERVSCYCWVLVNSVISSEIPVFKYLCYVKSVRARFFCPIFYATFKKLKYGLYSCHISLLNWWSSHVFIRLAVVKLREYWVNAILCMVSFLPFGDCGPCKFHVLPHLLALLYGTGYTVEAIHIQYDNDFLWFIQVMDYHWLW